MFTLEKIKDLERKSTTNLQVMKKVVDQLADRIHTLHLDGTHTEAYIKEQVETERNSSLPGIQKLFDTIKQMAEELKKQAVFWESTPMVLSQFRFIGDDDNPLAHELMQDAQARMAIFHELSVLPEPLIKLHYESALEEKNYAMLYQCYLAGQKFSPPFGLNEDLDIPNQLEALLSIEQGQINASEAEFLMRDAVGTRLAPETRLTYVNTKEEIELRIRNIKNRIGVARAANEKSGV